MKTAIVFGSTGLIGGHLINQLIQDNYYNKIKIFVRSQTSINNEKVEVINIDFNNLGRNHKTEITGDDCFFCIGTTKQNSPDKNDYQKVESGNYVKFKGLVEEELKRLNFSKLGILRPSFLMGKRKENRVGEKLGILTFRVLSPLLFGPFKKMKPISSEIVAKAMIKIAKENLLKITFESDEILKL